MRAQANKAQTNEPSNVPALSSTSIDIAKALKMRLANNMTYQEIADAMGHSKAGVYQALSKIIALIDDPAITNQFRAHKAQLTEAVQLKYLVHLANKDTIKAASANNAAYTIGQLNNIIRLDRDQSTTNAAIKAEISFLSPGEEVPDNTADISFNEGNDDGS